MTCHDCGEPLDTVPVGQPCPQCRGVRRDAMVMAQTAEARAEAMSPTIAIGYPDPRPWRQKLQDVEEALEPIKHAYTSNEGLSNEVVRRDIENFFKVCRELADWLWQNTTVSKPTVMKIVQNSHFLRLADAMAQTTKHHTRTGRDNPITARIAEIHITPEGARARIEWSRPAGSKGSRDALELAYGCLRSWRRFVRAQKL